MRQYEVTFIVDSVLSSDEIEATSKVYQDMLVAEGAKIVHTDEMGLRQLAYPIKNRTTGIYYCFEYQVETGDLISKIDLAMRRDERIMRSLVIKLDKYGIQYNEDKRAGKIGKVKKKGSKDDSKGKGKPAAKSKPAPAKVVKPTPAAKATVAAPVVAAPVVTAPVVETLTTSKEEE